MSTRWCDVLQAQSSYFHTNFHLFGDFYFFYFSRLFYYQFLKFLFFGKWKEINQIFNIFHSNWWRKKLKHCPSWSYVVFVGIFHRTVSEHCAYFGTTTKFVFCMETEKTDSETPTSTARHPPDSQLTHLCRPVRSTFAVRETASLGIMGEPRVPPLNPSESIVLSEHYRLWGI